MGENILSNKKKRALAKKQAKQGTKKQKKPLKSTLLVVCEGYTEIIYLRSLLSEFYSEQIDLKNSIIKKSSGTDPVTVVDEAIRQYEGNSAFDLVVCVFDRDSYHLNGKYQTALQKCRDTELSERKSPTKKSLGYAPRIFAIVNVPCFELWFLLTYKSTTKHYVRKGKKSPADCLISELESSWPHGEYNKTAADNFYLLGHNDKNIMLDNNVNNANHLDRHCTSTGTDEPSTTMHKFVEVLEKNDIIPVNKKRNILE